MPQLRSLIDYSKLTPRILKLIVQAEYRGKYSLQIAPYLTAGKKRPDRSSTTTRPHTPGRPALDYYYYIYIYIYILIAL